MTSDDSASLRALAAQCRQLARGVSTADVAASLTIMAEDYERKADALDRVGGEPDLQPVPPPPPQS